MYPNGTLHFRVVSKKAAHKLKSIGRKPEQRKKKIDDQNKTSKILLNKRVSVCDNRHCHLQRLKSLTFLNFCASLAVSLLRSLYLYLRMLNVNILFATMAELELGSIPIERL